MFFVGDISELPNLQKTPLCAGSNGRMTQRHILTQINGTNLGMLGYKTVRSMLEQLNFTSREGVDLTFAPVRLDVAAVPGILKAAPTIKIVDCRDASGASGASGGAAKANGKAKSATFVSKSLNMIPLVAYLDGTARARAEEREASNPSAEPGVVIFGQCVGAP